MNNFSNVSTGLIPNDIIYDFKVRDRLTTFSKTINGKFMTDEKFKKNLNETRFQFRQKASDVVVFENVKAKLIHDKKYKSLLLKEGNKAYLRFHKGYKLSGNLNRKLFNQRCGPFLVKRRVERLVYELKFFFKWRVHSVISVSQLNSPEKTN